MPDTHFNLPYYSSLSAGLIARHCSIRLWSENQVAIRSVLDIRHSARDHQEHGFRGPLCGQSLYRADAHIQPERSEHHLMYQAPTAIRWLWTQTHSGKLHMLIRMFQPLMTRVGVWCNSSCELISRYREAKENTASGSEQVFIHQSTIEATIEEDTLATRSRFLRGNHYFQKKDYAQAITAFETYLRQPLMRRMQPR